MTTQKSKIARAVCVNGQTLFDVIYDGRVEMDSAVPYSYLRKLAQDGYEVHVAGYNQTQAHVIPAEKQ